MKKGQQVALALAATGSIILVIALAKKAAGEAPPVPVPPGCKYLDKVMQYYYFAYTGPAQPFQAALGECYDVIYTIDVWDEETQDYWPPTNPMFDTIFPGAKCRVMVQAPCTLCDFS